MKVQLTHALSLAVVALILSNMRMYWRIEELGSRGGIPNTAQDAAALSTLDAELRARLSQLEVLDTKLADTLAGIKSGALAGPASARKGDELAGLEDPDDIFNVRLPSRTVGVEEWQSGSSGTFQVEKLSYRYLELKANAHFNWGNYYNMETIRDNYCKNPTTMAEFDPKCVPAEGDSRRYDEICPGIYDHTICLDDFKPSKELTQERECIVYDFGIREQPEFGVMLSTQFGCEVHAFDPSPISTEFYRNNQELQANKNYHFHEYGAGGRDGTTTLYAYNWGQVSIIQNAAYQNKTSCAPDYEKDGQCSLVYPHAAVDNEFKLQVKTVPTIMKQLGHKWIDIIKIDVEGSEYGLLENIFDVMGCPPCNQLTVEWHHFPLDVRYGAGSSPPLNQLTTLLHRCGFRQFQHHLEGGWPTGDAKYQHMNMHDMRYNIASFMRIKKK